jgi:signal transduction histidine kinase
LAEKVGTSFLCGKISVKLCFWRKSVPGIGHAMRANSAEGDRADGDALTEQQCLARLFHDMRGPLNIVIGMSDLLVRGEVDPGSPQHMEFLRDILQSGQRLLQLVDGASCLMGNAAASGRTE